MATTALVGTGTTLALSSSTWTVGIRDINWTGLNRGFIDTSTMATTGGRTFSPHDLVDYGEVTIDYDFNPDTATNLPPFGGAAETWTIGSISNTNDDLSFSGFIIGNEISIPHEDKMVGTVTIKITGAVTHTVNA